MSLAVVNAWLPETRAEARGAASAGAAGPLNILRFRKPKPLTTQQLQRERGNLVQKFEAESNALYEATKHVSHADAGCTAIIKLLLLSLLLSSAIVAVPRVMIMIPALEHRYCNAAYRYCNATASDSAPGERAAAAFGLGQAGSRRKQSQAPGHSRPSTPAFSHVNTMPRVARCGVRECRR